MKRPVAILLLLVLVGAAVAIALQLPGPPEGASRPPQPPPPAAPAAPSAEPPVAGLLPLPAHTPTTFLNTGAGEKYVGSAACAGCHANNHKSYLLTAHSRAMEDVSPATEPPDGAFDHKASGRSYRVYRRDGQLWHEEVLRTPEGKEVARTELPVRYRIGSGHFTRTYAVEVEGFLHESPVTWYASRKAWDVSPGYDIAANPGFERPIGPNCVMCHAGRWDQVDGTDHRLAFPEKAIGCENCHGPGARHAERHRGTKAAPGEPDPTIVNPARLPRALLESVCASCHLSAVASTTVRGHKYGDFRPGLPLSDFQMFYAPGGSSDKMTVVGHVEQLRQSACYQKSDRLTCVTCHDPHAGAKPADPVAFYRRKCIECHEQKPCAVPPPQRLKTSAADDCAACHMPRGDTEIQHVAFTHHRIGRHGARPHPEPPSGSDRAPDLVPLDANPNLSAADRDRNLGLAYLGAAGNKALARHANEYATRAHALLRAAYRAGARDADLIFALADLSARGRDMSAAAALAREALDAPGVAPITRAQCLDLLTAGAAAERNWSAAAGLMEQVVRLRRFGGDWAQLGGFYLDDRNPEKAAPAFRRALAVWPFYPSAHYGLAECYRRAGDHARGAAHFETGQWLQRNAKR